MTKTAELGKKGKSPAFACAAGRPASPALKSDAGERAFREANDSTDHLDRAGAKAVHLPNLMPTSKSISLRLPIGRLEALRIEANRRDVPCQSLIKRWLSERVEKKSLL